MNHDSFDGPWNQLKNKDETIDDDFLKSAADRLFGLLQQRCSDTEATALNRSGDVPPDPIDLPH